MTVLWRCSMNECENKESCLCWKCSNRSCNRHNCELCEETEGTWKVWGCTGYKEIEREEY